MTPRIGSSQRPFCCSAENFKGGLLVFLSKSSLKLCMAVCPFRIPSLGDVEGLIGVRVVRGWSKLLGFGSWFDMVVSLQGDVIRDEVVISCALNLLSSKRM